MLTPEQALEKAEKIIKEGNDDPAKIHPELDDLLCELLRPLGYGKLIDLYYEQERWFE
jgi:hypothetical protein